MDTFLTNEVWPGVPEPRRRVLRHVLFKRPFRIRSAEDMRRAPPALLLEVRDATATAAMPAT